MNLSKVTWIFLHPKAEDSLNQIGVAITDILADNQLSSSKSEGRRAIEGGGIRINDLKVTDPLARLVFDKENNEFFVVQRERFAKQ